MLSRCQRRFTALNRSFHDVVNALETKLIPPIISSILTKRLPFLMLETSSRGEKLYQINFVGSGRLWQFNLLLNKRRPIKFISKNQTFLQMFLYSM